MATGAADHTELGSGSTVAAKIGRPNDALMGLDERSRAALVAVLRHDLRWRWKRMLGVALLLGVSGGLVAGLAIGAHRTSTAYERFLDQQRAYDVGALENLGNCESGAEDCNLDHFASLSQLATVGRITVFQAEVLTADGKDVGETLPRLLIVRPETGVGTDVNRTKVLSGRMPKGSREVMVGVEVADRLDIHVGDILQFRFLVTNPDDPDPFVGSHTLADPVSMSVAGIGVSPGEIAPPSGQFVAMIQLARDFATELDLVTIRGALAILQPDASFEDLVAEMTARRLIVDASTVVPDQAEAIQREVRTQAASLALMALLGGAASFAVLGQLLARHLRAAAKDHRTLSDIGFGRRELLTLGAWRGLAIAVTATAVASVVAVCVSPWMPIGVAAVAEPQPGLQFTPLRVLLGALVTGLLVLLAAIVPVWRQAGRLRQPSPPRHPHAIIGRVAPSPVLATGARFAFERGSGPHAVPLGSSLLAAAFGVMALAAAVVFASGLDHLLATPRLSGWNWDITIEYPQVPSDSDGDDFSSELLDVNSDELKAVLDANSDIESYAFGTTRQPFPNYSLRLGDEAVPVVQLFVPMISIVGYEIGPTVIDGRAPSGPDEILLGPESLDDLDVEIGDTIKVWGRAYATEDTDERDVVIDMTIVGSGVIPISEESSSRIGRGASMTYDGLRRLREEPFDSPGYYDTVFLNLRNGATAENVQRAVFAALGVPADGQKHFTTWDQPRELLALESLRTGPRGVAAMMAVLAVASVAHLLLSTVRMRRSDIAILKCIGMSPGQVRRAVSWQASITALAVLATGLPVGILAGRFAWLAFAEDFGAAPEAAVPFALFASVVVSALVLVNLAAVWPARRAAQQAPATVLKTV